MNKKNSNRVFLILIGAMFLLSVAIPTASAQALSYSEKFDNDTTATDPTESWYGYEDKLFEYANVTANATSHSGANCFQVNDTTVADKSGAFFNLTTANDMDYFSFWFRINNTHNQSRIYILDSAGTGLARFDIFGNANRYVRFRNYTSEIWNYTSLANDTWYRLRWDFNYTDNTMRGRLFSSGGTTLNDSYAPITDATGEYDYEDIAGMSILGVANEVIYLQIDNLASYHYEWGAIGETTTNMLTNILPIIIAVALISIIVGMAFAMGATKEGLITILILSILAIVVIQVITSL